MVDAIIFSRRIFRVQITQFEEVFIFILFEEKNYTYTYILPLIRAVGLPILKLIIVRSLAPLVRFQRQICGKFSYRDGPFSDE